MKPRPPGPEVLADQIREDLRIPGADEELPHDALAIHDEAERSALDAGETAALRDVGYVALLRPHGGAREMLADNTRLLPSSPTREP
jgi:hypothetical protein